MLLYRGQHFLSILSAGWVFCVNGQLLNVKGFRDSYFILGLTHVICFVLHRAVVMLIGRTETTHGRFS